ncbi:MAG TPA: hypothetical protein VN829_18295 [Dongiaceae bacterium]|nr:hypothetical protein [Dongiaceae bacterium]
MKTRPSLVPIALALQGLLAVTSTGQFTHPRSVNNRRRGKKGISYQSSNSTPATHSSVVPAHAAGGKTPRLQSKPPDRWLSVL